jgi:hypothetical protein
MLSSGPVGDALILPGTLMLTVTVAVQHILAIARMMRGFWHQVLVIPLPTSWTDDIIWSIAAGKQPIGCHDFMHTVANIRRVSQNQHQWL